MFHGKIHGFPVKIFPRTPSHWHLDPFLRRCRWRTCFQRKGSPESSCWPLRRWGKRDDWDDRHGKQRALGMIAMRDDSFFLGEESRFLGLRRIKILIWVLGDNVIVTILNGWFQILMSKIAGLLALSFEPYFGMSYVPVNRRVGEKRLTYLCPFWCGS